MTQGIDVSSLFSEMCMLSFTTDIISKKMIYLFLTTYAENHPELALMAINSFYKDCQSTNPTIRAYALRSLCSQRFNGAQEYLQQQILLQLNDYDPHVRKTAIMGVIKLYHTSPQFVDDNNLIDTLYNMLKDPIPSVVVNAVCALNEIMFEEGGMVINNKIIMHLLSKIEKFDDYGKAIILEVTSRYVPKNEEETFEIMNHLYTFLKQVRGSTIQATIKIFLNFALNDPKLLDQVIEKIKGPLLTLMSSRDDDNEIKYVAVCHISQLVNMGANTHLEADYKRFFCQAKDPLYIQEKKLEIIVNLTNKENQTPILNELGYFFL